jgi:predicted nuclease of predicted toxin-antitoxin system
MRILANENFPRIAVEALRAAGHDVAWVRSEQPGSLDEEVLARAQAEGRPLLTFDKDFGELAFRSGLSAASGVILFRILAPSPAVLARLAVRVLDSRSDWAGHFCVIENDRIRMTPLPFTARSVTDPDSG